MKNHSLTYPAVDTGKVLWITEKGRLYFGSLDRPPGGEGMQSRLRIQSKLV